MKNKKNRFVCKISNWLWEDKILSETQLEAIRFPIQFISFSKTVRFALQNGAFCILKRCVLRSKMVRFAKRHAGAVIDKSKSIAWGLYQTRASNCMKLSGTKQCYLLYSRDVRTPKPLQPDADNALQSEEEPSIRLQQMSEKRKKGRKTRLHAETRKRKLAWYLAKWENVFIFATG